MKSAPTKAKHAHPPTYLLHGEITWEQVGKATEIIYQNYFEDPYHNLLVSIMSPGGDTDAAWSLYSAVKNLGPKVTTLAMGRVFSAGIIPFCMGHKRYAYPETLFLFHPVLIEPRNESKLLYQMYEDIKGIKYDNLVFKTMLLDLLKGAPRNKIGELINPSMSSFVNAKQAKEYGLVTDIITEVSQIEFD